MPVVDCRDKGATAKLKTSRRVFCSPGLSSSRSQTRTVATTPTLSPVAKPIHVAGRPGRARVLSWRRLDRRPALSLNLRLSQLPQEGGAPGWSSCYRAMIRSDAWETLHLLCGFSSLRGLNTSPGASNTHGLTQPDDDNRDSESPQQYQHKHNNQQKSQTSCRIRTPTRAIGPSWQCADQQ